MNIYQAYTYFIKWSFLDRSYYGVRYTLELNDRSPEDDFWHVYQSSSEVVKEFIIENGEPDIKCIDRKFDTANEALEYERKILRANKVVEDERWLNKNYGDHRPHMVGEKNPMYGKRHTAATKKLISESNKNRFAGEKNPMYGKKGEEHPAYGNILQPETRQKMSEAKKGENNYWYGVTGENHPLFGAPKSDKTKQKISKANSGENHPRFTGYYITPWGTFDSPKKAKENCPVSINISTLKDWCKNNQRKITIQSVRQSNYTTVDMIGKTFEEIGFGFQYLTP